MNISKISRSLVVAIFIVNIVFFGILDFKMLVSKDQEVTSQFTNLTKLGYVALVIILVLLYIYIKDKLYKKKIKRKVGLVFRYIYVSIVLIASKIGIVYLQGFQFTNKEFITYVLISFITGIIIKKIIFNVSKSDMLSVLATFSYALLPSSVVLGSSLILASSFSLVFFAGLLTLQILIDELKQRGIKTQKYVVESTILGIIIGVSMVFGINPCVWIAFAIVSIIVASNLDNTHISFPKKMMDSISQKGRERLYTIERININKLIVSICIVFIFAVTIYFISKFMLETFENKQIDNYYINSIIDTFNKNNDLNLVQEKSITSLSNFYNKFISNYKTFYMFCIIYIIFMEILAIALKRRYDTKSTMMKALFLFILNSIYLFNLNVAFYEPLLTVLIVLIAIVNTSNIYLNREERVKMLVA